MTQAEAELRKELEEWARFEILLVEISTGFINMPPDQVDQGILDAQRRICESLGIDRSTLWKISEKEPGELLLTHIHQPPEGPPAPDRMRATDFFPWSLQKILAGELVAISKLSDLPPEARRDQETYRTYGTKSTLLVPLAVGGGTVFGALSFAVMRKERVWPELLVKRIQLVAQVFANALARKRAEDALRQSQARLTLATDSADMGLWSMNIDTRQVWVTPKIRDLFQFAPDQEILYDIFLNAIHPEDRDKVRCAVQQVLQSGKDLRIEYRIVLRDGSVRWIASQGRPHFNTAGEPDSLIGVSMNFTERKQIEDALSESQARILALVENTSDLIWSVDAKRFGLLTFNDALRNYFFRGLGLEIHLGMTPEDMLPPEYASHWHEFYKRALRDGPFVIEYFTSAKSHVLLLSLNPLIRGGEVFGISVFGKDITDRKRMEEELRKSEERLRLVLEANSEGVWDWNIPSGHAVFTPRYSGMLGYEPDEFPKSYAAWKELVHPDDFERVNTAHAEHINEGKEFRVELRMRKKSGDWCWILSRGMVVERDAEGRAVRMVGTHLDITERKKAEEALRKSEERFRQVAESVSDFIWEVDANGMYRYTSPAVEKILGYTPDELVGKLHFYDLFPPDSREELKTAALNVFASKKMFRAFPNTSTRKDGSIVYLETSGIPMLDNEGNLIGYRGSDADVTERKKTGETLQQAFSEIKQLKERLEAENIYLREDIKKAHNFDKIIGQSDGLRYVLYRVEQVAGTDATVLILGETGTGKEVIAHAIHGRSLRKDRPMVTVNCAALPANLIESELFGRERGAFTGAHARQIGRFEVADKGTFFLDEIGELPLELQSKLLRVIQEGEFERLGSPHTIKVNVRIIASTSRDLREEIKKGRFREDLYYRLNVFPITIPPLRKRGDDIPLLVDHFVKNFSQKMGKEIRTIPRELIKALQDYAWPGNVRELEHIVERAVITTQDSVLRLAEKIDKISDCDRTGDLLNIVDVEREHMLKVLEQTKWRIEGKEGAASLLGLNPSTLRSRMVKLGISRQVRKSSPK